MKKMRHNGIAYTKLRRFRPIHNKYRLDETYRIFTAVMGFDIHTEFINLTADGWMEIRKGFPWDGPSGPTWDTKNFMRGSLVHDAFYWLLRKRHVPAWVRIHADVLLRCMCLTDGMSKLRATYVYRGVNSQAMFAALPEGPV